MRIAVIGGGSAGMTSAWLLQADHDVTLFESAARLGGHVHTVSADADGRVQPAEIGAEFFFLEGYSGLHALLARFGIAPIRDRLKVSFNIPGRASPIVAPPRDARSLASCLSVSALRDLIWLQRVGLAGERVVTESDWSVSVERLVERSGAPRDVADRLIVPLIASSWGIDREQALSLAAYGVVRVMGLRASQEAHSYRLPGGFSTYIEAMRRDAPRCTVKLSTPVRSVDHDGGGLTVRAGDVDERFDAVVLACDWHNSAAMCARSPKLDAWTRAFQAFEDYPTTVALHRDASYMPARPHHWGASNFSLTRHERPRTTVWTGRPTKTRLFRTWLRPGESVPPTTSHVAEYRHILCTTEHPKRQAALARLQGSHGVWAAGMYSDGIDNHESALRSALKVAQRIAPEAERVKWFSQRVSQ